MMNTESVYFCNYSIGEQAYGEIIRVCQGYGSKILLIGGKKALKAGEERLKERSCEK